MDYLKHQYKTESALVDDAIELFKSNSPWGDLLISQEFDYRRGRADIIAVNQQRHVLAFEAKLSKWRVAMHQAYRNGCFANYSYVILPTNVAQFALRNSFEFKKRSVGICSVQRGKIDVVLAAPLIKPLQPWLYENAIMVTEIAFG